MIALGLGAEAQALLRGGGRGRSGRGGLTRQGALAAIAALRRRTGADEAAGLDDGRLSGTDEIALWRAVRLAEQHEGSPQAAAVFAATWPLHPGLPAALRDRLLPLVAETW